MTFGTDGELRDALESMLLGSWQTFVDYTSPLGLSNMVAAAGAHYDPDPVASQPAHRSDGEGTGFDRTVATGTGFTRCYPEPLSGLYEGLDSCPDELLLFMHHVPYGHGLHSGRT
jgi:alpha-glucuronidase